MTLDPDPLYVPGSHYGRDLKHRDIPCSHYSRSPAVLSLVFAALSGFCLGIVVGLVVG